MSDERKIDLSVEVVDTPEETANGAEPAELATEWTVEARGGGTCVVSAATSGPRWPPRSPARRRPAGA